MRGEAKTRIGGSRGECMLAGAAAIWHLLVPGQAVAETLFSADVSAGVTAATNPYLFNDGSTSAVSVDVSIAPTVTVRDAAGEFRLSGVAQHQEFLRRYPSAQNFSVDAGYDRRLSSQLTFNGGVGFRSSINGANQIFNPIGGGVIIDPSLPPVVPDITLNGLRQRQTSFSTSAGFTARPNPCSSRPGQARLRARWISSAPM